MSTTEDVKKLIDGTASEKDWDSYFTVKLSEMFSDYSNIVNGVPTTINRGFKRVGYTNLRNFYEGDQWLYVPESGQDTKVYNFCRPTVINYTAFMTNEPLDIDAASEDITDPVEVARAEAKEKVLMEILDDNSFPIQFEEGVQNGSLLGDSIILGPFYDENEDRIWFQNVKRPENVKIIWKDDKYKEIFGFIQNYFISPEKATELWGDEIKKADATLQTTQVSSTVAETTTEEKRARFMVEVRDAWTDSVNMLKIGEKIVKFDQREPDFVPIVYVANIIHPTEPFGISDLEDMLDAQVEYNEKKSDISEIINEQAFSKIWGKNLKPQEVESGYMQMIDIGDEGELIQDPRRTNVNNLSQEIASIKSDAFNLSGLNENIFGGAGVRAVTGRALAVLMQTINNRIKGRQTRWTKGLQTLFKNIFILIENTQGEDGKALINGFYKTDIVFPGTLLRNITDEINKFNAKLQSQETTMKNIGVPSPKDEKKLMKKELSDEMLMIEISRSPQLQLQVAQLRDQAIAQRTAGNKPQLREDENQGDEEPASAGGAPQQSSQTLEGAINQTNQRNGASVPIVREE